MTPQRFVRLREQGEWTQKELAKAMGCHWTSISRYENGARHIPEPVAHLLKRMVEDRQRGQRRRA